MPTKPTSATVQALLNEEKLAYDVVSSANREELRNEYSHPFADECEAGDLLWRLPQGDGPVVAVWFRNGKATAAIGTNREPTFRRGTLLPGLVLQHGEPGHEEYVDLRNGKPAMSSRVGANPK